MKALTKDLFIANEIKILIEQNHITPGEKIPSERMLCEKLKTQRLTLRAALNILEQEGLIKAVPKVGYYLNEHRVQRDVNSISSILKVMIPTDNQNVCFNEIEEIEANKNIAKETSLPLGTRMYQIKLLKHLNLKPIYVDYIYLQKKDFPHLDACDFKNNNILNILLGSYEFQPKTSIQKIHIIKAEKSFRSLLELNKNDHIVLQYGCIYGENNKFIAFIESYINYNYFEYILK